MPLQDMYRPPSTTLPAPKTTVIGGNSFTGVLFGATEWLDKFGAQAADTAGKLADTRSRLTANLAALRTGQPRALAPVSVPESGSAPVTAPASAGDSVQRPRLTYDQSAADAGIPQREGLSMTTLLLIGVGIFLIARS